MNAKGAYVTTWPKPMLKTHWRFSNKFILQCWTSLLVIQVNDIIISGSFDSSSVWGQCPSTAPPLPHLYQMQTHQAVLKGISILLLHIDKNIRLSNLTRRHYKNIIIQIALCWIIWYWSLNHKLWCCRSNQTLPIITAFSSTVKIKYETEKYIPYLFDYKPRPQTLNV